MMGSVKALFPAPGAAILSEAPASRTFGWISKWR